MPGELGPWSQADLTQTARLFNGVGADDDLPKFIRFLRNVATLVRRRRHFHNWEVNQDPIAVFLLSATPPVPSPHPRVPMLGNGEAEITGRIWYVSEIVQSGRYFTADQVSDAEIFDYVTEQLSSGSVPAVVFNPRLAEPELRYYPEGLSNEDACESISIRDDVIKLDEILDVITRMHESCFVTPDAQIEAGSRVWHDSDKHWVLKRSEAVVQAHLKTALAARFLNCDVRHEQTMTAGRVDLEIEQPSLSDGLAVLRPAVIEVKVLRSRNSRGRASSHKAILRWIARGVRQTAAYRDERKALNGILCCFDMRTVDTQDQCFDHVRPQAASLSITLSRWFLYHSAEAYRVARYA